MHIHTWLKHVAVVHHLALQMDIPVASTFQRVIDDGFRPWPNLQPLRPCEMQHAKKQTDPFYVRRPYPDPMPQYLRRWLQRVKKAEKAKEVEKAAPDTKAMKVKKAEKASKASPATKAIDKALDTLGDTRLWSDDKVLGHEARKHCRQAIKHCRKVIKALEALVDQ